MKIVGKFWELKDNPRKLLTFLNDELAHYLLAVISRYRMQAVSKITRSNPLFNRWKQLKTMTRKIRDLPL